MGVGDDPRHRDAAQLLQRLQSRFQNGPVAPKLVDHHALDAAALVLLQQRHCAVELGEHAASVDVAHQQHRRVHQLGKAHIDDIVLLKVDLRRAACSLNDDHVILCCQTVVGLQHGGDIVPLAAEILHGLHITPHLSVDDDLTAYVGGGLEQDGVHAGIRLDPGGLCLHHLRPAHLAAVPGNEGVQRHVLALERRHAVAVLLQNAAESRRQQAFSRIGHGPLYHNIHCHSDFSLQNCRMAVINASFSP